MRLYSYWRSSAAYRVRIALDLKGIEHEIVPVSLAPGTAEHRGAAYRDINPQMLVPFLEDGTVRCGQSMAILEYLEEAHPAIPLLPADPALRAAVRAFCQVIACDVHPLNNLRVMNYLRKDLAIGDGPFADWYSHWIHEAYAALETVAARHVADGPFCFGADASLADAFLVPQTYNARRFDVALDAFPRLVAIVDHCNALEAFVAALPENQADAP